MPSRAYVVRGSPEGLGRPHWPHGKNKATETPRSLAGWPSSKVKGQPPPSSVPDRSCGWRLRQLLLLSQELQNVDLVELGELEKLNRVDPSFAKLYLRNELLRRSEFLSNLYLGHARSLAGTTKSVEEPPVLLRMSAGHGSMLQVSPTYKNILYKNFWYARSEQA